MKLIKNLNKLQKHTVCYQMLISGNNMIDSYSGKGLILRENLETKNLMTTGKINHQREGQDRMMSSNKQSGID